MTKKILPKMVGCVAVLVMLCLSLPAVAAVYNVSGDAATQDTWINDFIPIYDESDVLVSHGQLYNYGGSDFIELGDLDGDEDTYDDDQRHGMIKFDLSGLSVPAGQKVAVNSATLTMYYTGSGDPDIIIALFPITEANADWVEGTSDGTVAVADVEPNWFYKANQWDFWASAQNGLLAKGVDYIFTDPNFAPLLDCVDNDQTGVESSAVATLPAETVAGWINTPATNGGLLMVQKESATSLIKFVSSDNAETTRVPVLSVDYTLVSIECGDEGTGLLTSDFSGPGGTPDCKVDSYDLAAFMAGWLDCSNEYDANCQ